MFDFVFCMSGFVCQAFQFIAMRLVAMQFECDL